MEIIFVELPHEAGEVAVLEVFRQDVFREFFVLRAGQRTCFPPPSAATPPSRSPTHTSSTTKLSPSFPQRTTLSSWGHSSILKGVR